MELGGLATPNSGIGDGNGRINRGTERKRMTSDLPRFSATLDTVIIPRKRTGPRQKMGNEVRPFLAKIRPASNRKTGEPTSPYFITNTLKRVGMIRKGNKMTTPHIIVGGWYMHGKKAGEPTIVDPDVGRP